MNGAMKSWRASYVKLARSGELEGRVKKLDALLADCTVCPRACRVDRRHELGECATGADAVIASLEASASGKDYPAGEVLQTPRREFWYSMEEYQPYFDTFFKRPEYSGSKEKVPRALRLESRNQ